MKEISFKNLSTHFGYLGSFIIFLGMVYNILFYYYFGIKITSYFSFSEIITSFFDIILSIVFSISILIIQFFIALNKDELKREDTYRTKILNETKSIKIFWLYLKYHYIYLIMIMLLFSCYFFSGKYLSQNLKETALLGCVVAIFINSFYIAELELKRKYKSLHTKKPWFIDIILYCVLFTLFIGYLSYHKAKMVRQNKVTFGVTIILDDNSQLFSDSSNYYIGKTDNYVFFYHEKTRSTDIFPVSRIKQLTIKTISTLDFFTKKTQ